MCLCFIWILQPFSVTLAREYQPDQKVFRRSSGRSSGPFRIIFIYFFLPYKIQSKSNHLAKPVKSSKRFLPPQKMTAPVQPEWIDSTGWLSRLSLIFVYLFIASLLWTLSSVRAFCFICKSLCIHWHGLRWLVQALVCKFDAIFHHHRQFLELNGFIFDCIELDPKDFLYNFSRAIERCVFDLI